MNNLMVVQDQEEQIPLQDQEVALMLLQDPEEKMLLEDKEAAAVNDSMLLQDQDDQIQDGQSNLYENQQQNSFPSFTSEVKNTTPMVTLAFLPSFIPVAEGTTDVGLQWPEGSNTVSMHEKIWVGQSSHQNGSSSRDMPPPSINETTLTTPFQCYSSMKYLGDGGDFGYSDGIRMSENLPHPMLSNIPDAPIRSSSLQPVGQPMGLGFNTQSSGDGMSSFSRMSNAVPTQFQDLFSAHTGRDQFANYGLNDRTTRGMNSLYPMHESSLYGVLHGSSALQGTLAGNSQNNFGAGLSGNSALTTISDVKIALERHALSRKKKTYSFEDIGISGIAGCTGSSFYPTVTNDPTVALIGFSTAAYPTSGFSSSTKETLDWHCNSTATDASAPNSSIGMPTAGIGSFNLSNYNGFDSGDIISSSMMPHHTVIPQSAVNVQTAQSSLAEQEGANMLQSSANNKIELCAIPHTEGYALMDDLQFDYDNNGDTNIETELDTGDFILVVPSDDSDTSSRNQCVQESTS